MVYDAKWVTLSLGEAQESGREFEVSEEGDEPIPAEVGKFTGLILAVRCRDAKEGRTDTDFRIYRIKDGKVIGRERSTSSLAAGELKELALP
ncbi:MAG TPA: hypothetical protein VJU16_06025 [Planctomycetota bacterium]|nr:hypothetical protein [Planctomycetota bacterium]